MADCNSAMPSNGFGFQYPFEGKAYAGLNVIQDARQVFNKQGGNKATFRSRGYMRLILAQPLVKNHKYKFSLYVTLGERSAFGVSNLYIDVSERRLKQDKADTACLVADNSFMLTGGRAMYDTINWNNINTEFTAKGGERFITIGLFKGGLSYSGYMALLKNPSNSKGNGCNYFIDNIELREL